MKDKPRWALRGAGGSPIKANPLAGAGFVLSRRLFRRPADRKMSPLVETILFIFGLVALGYIAGATGYLKAAEHRRRAVGIAVGVALPLLLFRTMVTAEFHCSAPWGLWGVYVSAVIVAWTAGIC